MNYENVKSIVYIVQQTPIINSNDVSDEEKTELVDSQIIAAYEVVKVVSDINTEYNIYLDNTDPKGYMTSLQFMTKIKEVKSNKEAKYKINWGYSYTLENKLYNSPMYEDLNLRDDAAKINIGYDLKKAPAIKPYELKIHSIIEGAEDVKSMAYIMGDSHNGLGIDIVEKYEIVKVIDEYYNEYFIFINNNINKIFYTYNELLQEIAENSYRELRYGYRYTIKERQVYSKTYKDILSRNNEARKEIGYEFDRVEPIPINNFLTNNSEEEQQDITEKRYNKI